MFKVSESYILMVSYDMNILQVWLIEHVGVLMNYKYNCYVMDVRMNLFECPS